MVSFSVFQICRCKEELIIHGDTVKIKYVENNTIFLKSPKGTLAVFLVFENRCHYCPLL